MHPTRIVLPPAGDALLVQAALSQVLVKAALKGTPVKHADAGPQLSAHWGASSCMGNTLEIKSALVSALTIGLLLTGISAPAGYGK